jgi:cell division initiation protein
MSGEKRFRKSLFGYKKYDVNTYIDKLVGEYDHKLAESEEELASLKKQLRDMKAKYDEIVAKTDERTKIAEVLIKAQEKAENIIEEAQLKALEEKKKLNEILEDDRERVVDMKQLLKNLKENAMQVMKNFDGEIDNLLIENDKQIDGNLKEIS